MLLERALIATLIIHGLAMVAMAAFLLPGLPGGTSTNDAERVAYIANHVLFWRLGWFPWQMTAVSNLFLGFALTRTSWIPRVLAWGSLLLSLVAVSFEQPGEFWWVTKAIDLAQQAVATGNPAIYVTAEDVVFARVSAIAPIFYTLSAVLWSICFAKAQVWNKFMTYMSVVLWGIMFAISIAPILPPDIRPAPAIVAVGNATGFILLMLWFAIITELVLRRRRPFAPWGRWAPWHHPAGGIMAWALDLIGNSRLAHELVAWLPQPAMVSDINNVIYVNYLVDAAKLLPLVPPSLELQRLGPEKTLSLFTFLTYNHGHFGPRFLGPLRKLLPSPVQSNWRIHVTDPRTGKQGIHFVTTAMGATLNALVARCLSDGIAMHVPAQSYVQCKENERLAGSGQKVSQKSSEPPVSDAAACDAGNAAASNAAGNSSKLLPSDGTESGGASEPMVHDAKHVDARVLDLVGNQIEIELLLEPGQGSSPDARASLVSTNSLQLPSDWRQCFNDFTQMLAYCVPDRKSVV